MARCANLMTLLSGEENALSNRSFLRTEDDFLREFLPSSESESDDIEATFDDLLAVDDDFDDELFDLFPLCILMLL